MSFRGIDQLPASIPYVGMADSANLVAATANRGILIPFWLPRTMTFRAWRFCRSAGPIGNLDLGIYRSSLQRLFSTGSIAYPAAPPVVSTVNFPTGPIGLGPGLWYIGFAASGAQQFFCDSAALLIANCVRTNNAAFPLPATFVGGFSASADVPAIAVV